MDKKPVGETYTGPSGGLKKPSDWLASEDIPVGQDVEVEIEDVLKFLNVAFEAGRVEPKLGALKFVGKDKLMILNATNRKRLMKAYTSDTKLWRKKKIKIFVDMQCKQVGGGKGPGLRIRIEETGAPEPENP